MSSNNNDTKLINELNYEEFFVLYMDNELTSEEILMVDDFLASHPDHKAEFELLLCTKLTYEDSDPFPKKNLLSTEMNKKLLAETLLLYIDNELPENEAQKLNSKIQADQALKLEYEILLKTRLDPSEYIPYPNKKELYSKKERVMYPAMWMRVAASVILILAGLFYFTKNRGYKPENNSYVHSNIKHTDSGQRKKTVEPVFEIADSNSLNVTASKLKKLIRLNKQNTIKIRNNYIEKMKKESEETANRNEFFKDEPIREKATIRKLDVPVLTNSFTSVTSAQPKRIIYETASPMNPEPANLIAGNTEKKGSLKSFLRKAARVIEKKTGIDPANNEDELLIGVVAIKLK